MRWNWFFLGLLCGAAGVSIALAPRAIARRRLHAQAALLQRSFGEDDALGAPERTMKIAGIVKLQRALNAAGTKAAETGRLDAQTQIALRAYQEREGLAVTGLPDYQTLRRLDVPPDEVFRRLDKSPRASPR
jgi:hypothetical protein